MAGQLNGHVGSISGQRSCNAGPTPCLQRQNDLVEGVALLDNRLFIVGVIDSGNRNADVETIGELNERIEATSGSIGAPADR